MKPKQRWLVIGGLLLATLLAGYFAEDDAVPEKGKRKGSTVAKTAASARAGENRRSETGGRGADMGASPLEFPKLIALDEEMADGEKVDPFRSKTWFVPPPPPKPVKPTAPPLPFQFLGKITEDGETRVFLSRQGSNLIAKVGDVINGTYSVEEIAGGRMVLLYLPLKETQVLTIGGDK